MGVMEKLQRDGFGQLMLEEGAKEELVDKKRDGEKDRREKKKTKTKT